jgi:hypothetical protein
MPHIIRQYTILLACVLFGACHRPTEVRGMYVGGDSTGTLFPCNEPRVAVAVEDTALMTRYRATAVANKPVFVRLRGVNAHGGSIYSGRRYFQVQQILEVRARAAGECPGVAAPIASFLPDR